MKTTVFNSLENSVQSFKALGDENRLRMVALLRSGELCVCDIMAVLELPQSTASRHLAYLKNSAVLQSRRKGKWIYYQLSQGFQHSIVYELINNLASELPGLRQDQKKLEKLLQTKDEQERCSK